MTKVSPPAELKQITFADAEALFRRVVSVGKWEMPDRETISLAVGALELLREATIGSRGRWGTNDRLVHDARRKLLDAAAAISALREFIEREGQEYAEYRYARMFSEYNKLALSRDIRSRPTPQFIEGPARERPDSAGDLLITHAFKIGRADRLASAYDDVMKICDSEAVSLLAPLHIGKPGHRKSSKSSDRNETWHALARPLLAIVQKAMAPNNPRKTIDAKSNDGPASRFILPAIELISGETPTGDDLRKFFKKSEKPDATIPFFRMDGRYQK